MKLVLNDIPRHGLLLIDPFDPFSEKGTSSFTSRWRAIEESIPELCVALLNESNKILVAYRLLWIADHADGKRAIDEKSFANIQVLMGINANLSGDLDHGIISPGGFRLFSTETHLPILGSLAADQFGIGVTTAGVQSITYGDVAGDSLRATVTIDGAFFHDGSFVGPDRTRYFESVCAEVKAKFDILSKLSVQVENGTPLHKLFEDILKQYPQTRYRPSMSPDEVYIFYRGIFAQEILSMKSACGEAETVKLALRELQREWPRLRRI